jgi:rubredoxin
MCKHGFEPDEGCESCADIAALQHSLSTAEREIAELRSIVDAAKAYVKAACIGKVDGYNEWWALKRAVEQLSVAKPSTERSKIKDIMLYMGDNKRSFRWDCGCNVFKEIETDRFQCNSCGDIYDTAIKDVGQQPTTGEAGDG